MDNLVTLVFLEILVSLMNLVLEDHLGLEVMLDLLEVLDNPENLEVLVKVDNLIIPITYIRYR